MKLSSRRCASVIIACVLGPPLSGCHQGPPAAALVGNSESRQSANHGTPNRPRATAQAASFGGMSVPTPSFAGLMQTLPAKEQTQARRWYQHIGGPPMNDATPAEVAWMQARHYPMPNDIVRAESMSDAELKAAAATEDPIAQILYVARLLDKYSANIERGMSFNDRGQVRLQTEIGQIMPQILASGSPYAGYLYAAKVRLMDSSGVESSASAQLAGLVWASKFGDTRANQLMNTPEVQAVDAALAIAEMSSMLNDATRGGEKVFSTPVVPIPATNH